MPGSAATCATNGSRLTPTDFGKPGGPPLRPPTASRLLSSRQRLLLPKGVGTGALRGPLLSAAGTPSTGEWHRCSKMLTFSATQPIGGASLITGCGMALRDMDLLALSQRREDTSPPAWAQRGSEAARPACIITAEHGVATGLGVPTACGVSSCGGKHGSHGDGPALSCAISVNGSRLEVAKRLPVDNECSTEFSNSHCTISPAVELGVNTWLFGAPEWCIKDGENNRRRVLSNVDDVTPSCIGASRTRGGG
mmetsp:Transcript_59876/g.165670  ORF Transcript_59876/g.165670 Transcript_59876/m.165670 type:complete len:252 (+) Transcript_59876:212-967(+)